MFLGSRLRIPDTRAIRRPRIDELLARATEHRVTVVLAPAGSGKTTAVAGYAADRPDEVAWLTAGGSTSAATLLGDLGAAAARAIAGIDPAGWTTPTAVIAALESVDRPLCFAIDDVHALVGTEAEPALAAVVRHAPANVRFLLAGRREPELGLAELRVAGMVLTVGPDDLRFRSWEAEQLFRELYSTYLRPEDIARLAQRVEGWAAGLQLFHLASRNLGPTEQRALIDRLGPRSRVVRDYLGSSVLGPLRPGLREFLLDTCVLGVVTGELADRLRERDDSATFLRELVDSQVFTVELDGAGIYRYHDVLRGQLEALLRERDGSVAVTARYVAAARLLEEDGLTLDAMRCYAHGDDIASVRRLARGDGSRGQAGDQLDWIDAMPHALVADDAFLLLCRARAERARGNVLRSMATYAAAEVRALDGVVLDAARRERSELAALADPLAIAPVGWVTVLRRACRRDSRGVVGQEPVTPGTLVLTAAFALAHGHTADAEARVGDVIGEPDVGPMASTAALLVLAAARLVNGDAGGVAALDDAALMAERSGAAWVARLARACLALSERHGGAAEASRAQDACERDGDAWGAAIVAFVRGLAAARDGDRSVLDDAAPRFAALGAPVLARRATDLADIVGRPGRRTGDDLATFVGRPDEPTRQPIDAAPARGDRPRSDGAMSPRGHMLGTRAGSTVAADGAAAPLSVRCFGGFAVEVAGRPLALDSLRPRVRLLLRFLSLRTDQPVHRDVITEALWPDADSAVHNLHVAVSALRRLLASNGVADELGVVRTGESYQLRLASPDHCDVVRFRLTAAAARTASAHGDDRAAVRLAAEALALADGEVLAEDGAAEWTLPTRSWVSAEIERLASATATEHLDAQRYDDAIQTCERALRHRPFADELWRLLVRSHSGRGDIAAATRAQARYDEVLNALGVSS